MTTLLILSLAIVTLINVALFAVAYTRQSDKLTDLSYALSFIVVAISALLLSEHQTLLLAITVFMVIIWALRLGVFLVIRIRKSGKDSRFDSIRGSFFKFLKFWVGQGLVAWLLLLPVLFLAQREDVFNGLTVVGVVIWIGGIIVEALADIQKYRFTSNSKNKNKWIESGLWRYSRHPNYFGEVTVWVGIYLTVFSSLGGWERLVALVSPIAIFITLRFISGIPILEKLADERWGKDPGYRRYRKRTNLLVPFRPKSDQ